MKEIISMSIHEINCFIYVYLLSCYGYQMSGHKYEWADLRDNLTMHMLSLGDFHALFQIL